MTVEEFGRFYISEVENRTLEEIMTLSYDELLALVNETREE